VRWRRRKGFRIQKGDIVIELDEDFRGRARITNDGEISVTSKGKPRLIEVLMSKGIEKLLAFAFGVVFVSVLVALAVFIPRPTPYQYTVFRIVLALAAAGAAAVFPGFLTARVGTLVRAGGALAVFAVIYFYSPAALVVAN
jgi:hypothetical protein